MAALLEWDESGGPQMQDSTHCENQARPREIKSRHSKVNWLLLSLVMFGHLCILDSDLSCTTSMVVIFQSVGMIFWERLCGLLT